MPGVLLDTGLVLVSVFAGICAGFPMVSGEGSETGSSNSASSDSPSRVSSVMSFSAIWINLGLFSMRSFLAVS